MESQNLIKFAEQKALHDIEKLSDLKKGLTTKGEIIDRIEEINKNIRGLDLVIESRTFAELAALTGVKIPHLNDRILAAVELLIQSIEQKNFSVNKIQKALSILFEWDETLKSRVKDNLKDLEKYIQLQNKNALKIFTKKLIKKYPFHKDLYKHNLKTHKVDKNTQTLFHITIPFVDQIGPIISMYDSIFNQKDKDSTKLDVTLALIQFLLDHLRLESLYIVDIIPTLIRALVRKHEISENTALRMRTYQLLEIAQKEELGKILIFLATNIHKQEKKEIKRSHVGIRLWTELEMQNFWNSTRHRPKLAMLESIANPKSIKDPVKPLEPLTDFSGRLKQILGT